MNLRLVLIIFFSFSFIQCEDTKKTNDSNIVKDSKSDVNSKVLDSANSTPKLLNFPVDQKITKNNVVDFLTEYGKKNPETEVKIKTQFGDIILKLYSDTPLHRANFIYLVKQGYFDGTFFHRIVPNFIIQAGNSDLAETNKKRFKIGDEYLIPAEINSRKHSYGSVSGAKEYRENPDKQSAPFEFFIFLGPQKSTSHLNGNYTVFARVTDGMNTVEKIANLPSDDGEWPLNNVYITAEILD